MSGTCLVAILAAGGSRRMGAPKLAMPVDGVPILRRVADAASASRIGRVAVVLGGAREVYAPILHGVDVDCVVNSDWSEGIASSIRAAVRRAREAGAEQLALLLGDQPGVTAEHLRRLADAMVNGVAAAATEYAYGLGPPAIFAKACWNDLEQLRGDSGARSLLRSMRDVIAVPAAWPADDIDDPADYRRVTGREVS